MRKLLILIFLTTSFNVNGEIFDFHVHQSSSDVIESSMKSMSKHGIKKSSVISGGYAFLVPSQRKKENDFVSRFAKQSGHVGVCSVNLLQGDYAKELDRCSKLEGVKGVKLHLHSNVERYFVTPNLKTKEESKKLTYKNLSMALDIIKKNKVFLLVHADKSFDTEKLFDIAKELAPLPVIVAHAGVETSIDIQELHNQFEKSDIQKNVYFETSFFWQGENQVSSWREYGMDYLLFGSDDSYGDYVSYRFDEQLDMVNCLARNLSSEERNKILYNNANEVLEIIKNIQDD